MLASITSPGRTALRRAGQNHVARVQRVEGASPLDQLRDAENQVAGVRILPRGAVHRDLEREISGIGNLVARDEPRAQHTVGVGRLAQAPFLRPTDRHVEADAIAGDALERLGGFYLAAAFADDHGKLDFVIVAPIGMHELHAFARADE